MIFSEILDKDTGKEYEDYLFASGKRIEIINKLVTGKYWGKKFTDFHHGIADAYFVNDKFMNCLNGVRELNFQIFPITVMPEKEKYFVLNILNILDCVNREKSKFRLITEEFNRPDILGDYYDFDQMILDRSKVPNEIHLFRLKGYDVVTIATRELVEEFEKNKIKGFKLTPVG